LPTRIRPALGYREQAFTEEGLAKWRTVRSAGYESSLKQALKKSGRPLKDLTSIFHHNIGRPIPDLLGLSPRVSSSFNLFKPDFGHSGCNDIAWFLAQAVKEKTFRSGDLLALMAGGGGWSWATKLLEVS